jgi:hypothetical protein
MLDGENRLGVFVQAKHRAVGFRVHQDVAESQQERIAAHEFTPQQGRASGSVLGILQPVGELRGRRWIVAEIVRARANSIEGGTTEIAKNILGERVLGLPGDVRNDKDIPWAQVPRS